MSGICGFNVRAIGVSRDMVMQAQFVANGAFMLAHNDADLVSMARAAGVKTIYRQSGDEGEALAQNPAQFVQTRAEKGADYIHLTNEVTSSDALHTWTRKALEAATALGVKAVCYNYGTHADRASFDAARANIEYALAHGHAVGVHVYLDGINDADAFEWLPLKQTLGGLWIVTEFGYIRDYRNPYRGWRGRLDPMLRQAFLEKWMPIFARQQMPLCTFCFDPWDKPDVDAAKAEGFGFWDYADVISTMGRLNQTYTFESAPVQPTPTDKPIIDISYWQGMINWDVLASVVGGVIARATMGIGGVDPNYQGYANEASTRGVLSGFYHLLKVEYPGEDQANHFLNTVAGQNVSYLAVDVETDGLTAEQVLEFVESVFEQTGKRCLIYTRASFFDQFNPKLDAKFAEYPLWVAHYDVQKPTLPRAWRNKGYVLWQYTSGGNLDGIVGRVDLNRLADPVLTGTPMTVAAERGLRQRADALATAAVLRVLPYQAAVTVYLDSAKDGDGETWVLVKDADGNLGWCALRYLSFAKAFALKPPFRKYTVTDVFNSPRDYSKIAPTKLQVHEGIDFVDQNAKDHGSDPTVHVGARATVIKVGVDADGYGNYVYVDFGGNWRAYYAHLAEVYVKAGQVLAENQIIGLMGSTGFSTAPHLHLTVQHIGQGLPNYVVSDVVDPLPLIAA